MDCSFDTINYDRWRLWSKPGCRTGYAVNAAQHHQEEEKDLQSIEPLSDWSPYFLTHCRPTRAASAGVSQDHSAPRARMATQTVSPWTIRSSTE